MQTSRSSWSRRRALAAAGAIVALTRCHSPSDPPSACFVAPPEGRNLSALDGVLGSTICNPAGAVTITPRPNGGSFATTIRIRLTGARPGTLYYVQRAAEFPSNATSADKVCQRVQGTWEGFTGDPWVTFPRPSDQGPFKTLTTDAAGNAVLEFDYFSPTIPAGAKFDVMMRLADVNSTTEAGVTSELRSICMTIEVL